MNQAPLDLRWLEAASRDLNAIASYIGQFSRSAARDWLVTVDERVSLLSVHPRSGEAYPRDRDYRRIFLGNYVLYYTVEEKEIVIRGIIHGARLIRHSWLARRKRMKE
jgi:plasmid stabilization system protein ParE